MNTVTSGAPLAAPQQFGGRLLQGAGVLAWLLVSWLTWRIALSTDQSRAQYGAQAFLLGLYLAAFLYATRTGDERLDKRRRLAAIALQALCALGLMVMLQEAVIAVLLIVSVSQLPAHLSQRSSLALVAASTLLFCLLFGFIWQAPMGIFQALLYGSFMLFSVFTTEQAVAAQRSREALAHAHAELQATQSLLSATARQNERLNIARDLHDTLGHHLTALTIQLEIAAHLTGGEAKQQIEKSQHLAKLLLADVRATVSEMRDSANLDLQGALETLIAGIPRLAIEFNHPEPLIVQDAACSETLLRVTQELITNTLRHANASRLQLTLHATDCAWQLIAQDNGRGCAERTQGNGLRGIEERLRSIGGTLQINTAPGQGFRAELTIPLRLS